MQVESTEAAAVLFLLRCGKASSSERQPAEQRGRSARTHAHMAARRRRAHASNHDNVASAACLLLRSGEKGSTHLRALRIAVLPSQRTAGGRVPIQKVRCRARQTNCFVVRRVGCAQQQQNRPRRAHTQREKRKQFRSHGWVRKVSTPASPIQVEMRSATLAVAHKQCGAPSAVGMCRAHRLARRAQTGAYVHQNGDQLPQSSHVTVGVIKSTCACSRRRRVQ